MLSTNLNAIFRYRGAVIIKVRRGTQPRRLLGSRPNEARTGGLTCAASRNFRPPYFTNGSDSRIFRLRGLSFPAKRYVVEGDCAYIVGTQDGSFPGMGFHITGKMNGVWSHPLELLDSYQFLLDNTLFPGAEKFTSGPGFVQLDLPVTSGLKIIRTEFAPDGLPVVLISLEFQNAGAQPKSTALIFQPTSEILPAYPWIWVPSPVARRRGVQIGLRHGRHKKKLALGHGDFRWKQAQNPRRGRDRATALISLIAPIGQRW